jgi:hypothetical protein
MTAEEERKNDQKRGASQSPKSPKSTTTTSSSTNITRTEDDIDSLRDSAPIELHGEQMCSICADEMPAEECTALGCGHAFCNDCWDTYLTTKIQEGMLKKGERERK